jgi:hypothetical protein
MKLLCAQHWSYYLKIFQYSTDACFFTKPSVTLLHAHTLKHYCKWTLCLQYNISNKRFKTIWGPHVIRDNYQARAPPVIQFSSANKPAHSNFVSLFDTRHDWIFCLVKYLIVWHEKPACFSKFEIHCGTWPEQIFGTINMPYQIKVLSPKNSAK